jgi:DNA invertase Pin-like site-specific DNA recombinase
VNLRAVIYARVSSAGQRDRHTIASQLRDLPAYVATQGWTLVETFVDDGFSASTGKLEARDAYARLERSADAHGFDVVVVVDIDRLTRTEDMQERSAILGRFQRAGIQIATPTTGVLDLRTMMGELYITLGALVAAEENRKRVARTKAGKRAAAQRGQLVTGFPPYGLRYSREDRVWSIDPTAAPIVTEIFERTIAGQSCYAIAVELNRRGVTRPRGGPWSRARVWEVISSPSSKGEYCADREHRVVAAVPKLVSDETWAAAQLSLGARQRQGLSHTKHAYLAEGLGVCGCGGRIMIRSGSKVRGAAYECRHRRERGPCKTTPYDVAAIDERVWSAALRALEDPALLPALASLTTERAEDAHSWERDAVGYQAHLERLDKVKAGMLGRYRRGLLTEDELDRELGAVTREASAVRVQLAAAERAVAARSTAKQRLCAAHALVEGLKQRMSAATPEQRRDIVRTLIDPGDIVFGAAELRITVAFLRVDGASASGVSSVSGLRRETGHERQVRIQMVA